MVVVDVAAVSQRNESHDDHLLFLLIGGGDAVAVTASVMVRHWHCIGPHSH